MEDNHSPPATAVPATLNSFPPEILQNIFYFTTSTTFFQLIQVSRKFFEIASESRELILHHLRHVPGIKLGLDDRTVSTSVLFLIFRQRAASHLYGVNFTAECRNLEPSHAIFDPRASCLTMENDGCDSCVVFKNSLHVKCNLHNNSSYGDTIYSPYGDGRAKIIQVVQAVYCISVLYAWAPPQEDAEDTSHLESTIPMSVQESEAQYWIPGSRDDIRYRQKRRSPRLSATSPRLRYHLLHYDLFRNERPIFFNIPTHRSLYGIRLAPVHIAVHNRLQCAILWDLPDTILPTPNATVCLYKAENLPHLEPGSFDVWVIYPFDHAAPYRRALNTPNVMSNVSPGSDEDDEALPNSTGMIYTHTKVHPPIGRRGRSRDFDSDLRFLNFPLKPRSISFFKSGRRLSLYAPSSTIPFTTLLANESIRNRYHPSSSSPFPATTSWPPRSLCRRIRRTNHTSIHGRHFRLSLPFFSKHETISRPHPENQDPDEDEPVLGNECVTNMLCIGTTRIPTIYKGTDGGRVVSSPGPEMLAIVQIRERMLYDDCSHNRTLDDLPSGLPQPPREPRRRGTTINLNTQQNSDFTHSEVVAVTDGDNTNNNNDNQSDPEVEILSDSDTDDMGHGILDGVDIRVVARLWGWNAHNSSLTGLETLSVSPSGGKIAVALWDKILVYALNPAALCEEQWRNVNDGDIDSSQGGSDLGNDTDSDNATEDEDGDGSTISVIEDEWGTGDFPVHNTAVTSIEAGTDSGPPPQPPSSLQDQAPPGNTPHGLTPAVPNPPASTTSARSTSPFNLVNYYPHVFDKHLGRSIALIRPIVLKMDAGAVVRKMGWDKSKPARVDEDKNSSEVEEDRFDGPASEELVSEEASEKEAKLSDEDKDAKDVQVSGDEFTGPPTSQAAECEEREDGVAVSADIEMTGAPDQPKILSLSPPAFPNDITLESLSVKPFEHSMSSRPDELPPAPFSDLKLTGQIKTISRPPSEYYDFPVKTWLPPLNPAIPPSPTELESDMETVNEIPTDETEKVVDKESDTEGEADQTRGNPLATEDMAPAIGTAQVEPEAIVEPDATPEPGRKRKRKPRRRYAENELIVMTDRGIQMWDLSVWGSGGRRREVLPDCGLFQ